VAPDKHPISDADGIVLLHFHPIAGAPQGEWGTLLKLTHDFARAIVGMPLRTRWHSLSMNTHHNELIRSLEALRLSHYQFESKRVSTLADAARFIDRFGFCWLFAPRDHRLELPSLFEAVKGRRDAHIEDWDADSDQVWAWKNDLPAAQRAYYGKALAGKPCFISLKMLPYALAALGEEDFERAYARGAYSYDTKRVYDALKQFGAQPTQTLRRNAGFVAARGDLRQNGNARFHKALDELQRRLIAMPMGATNEGMAWPSQIFDLVARWLPEQTRDAKKLAVRDARRALVERYVNTVVAAPLDAIARLFAIPRPAVKLLVDELARAKRIRMENDWAVSKSKI
jgi:hypothetical protein